MERHSVAPLPPCSLHICSFAIKLAWLAVLSAWRAGWPARCLPLILRACPPDRLPARLLSCLPADLRPALPRPSLPPDAAPLHVCNQLSLQWLRLCAQPLRWHRRAWTGCC